jgi:hypothetical protein
MRRRRLVPVFAAAVALLVAASAIAGNFKPLTAFKLSSSKAGANPALTVTVKQAAGEEEIKSVTFLIPAGFSVPSDAAIKDGDQLGEGTIDIAAGPQCAGAPAGSVPFHTNVSIVERDRTADEKAQGVWSVWVVDLRPVTTIDLMIKGSVAKGWSLLAAVPANDFTCPPFTFTATVSDKSMNGKVPIFKNTKMPGSYIFQGVYESEQGSKYVARQTVRITR